jgi:hypothetical protein
MFKSMTLFIGSWFFNLLAMIDRSWISFVFGIILTVLGIINYWLSIKQKIKNKKDVGENK